MAVKDSATTLLLFLLSALQLVHAQTNLNLTVTFYPDSGDSCNSTSDGITFTTASHTEEGQCFNLSDLFSGNETFGFRNETRYPTAVSQDYALLYWRLEKFDAYDSQANYSNVLYQQPVANDNDGEGEGTDASRRFSIYSDKDCKDLDDRTESPYVQPWFGWTCSSSADGECHTVPYSVVSFKLGNAEPINERDGKCWDFAYNGKGSGNLAHLKGGLAAVVALTTIFFLLA